MAATSSTVSSVDAITYDHFDTNIAAAAAAVRKESDSSTNKNSDEHGLTATIIEPHALLTVPTTSAPTAADPKKHERQQWNNRIEFLLAAVGAAVGFGNFFRFPYLAYKFGGGAFLIPYCIALFFMGIPVVLMEISLGQLFRKSSVGVMSAIHKRFKGVGIASVFFGSFLVVAYYSLILSWVNVYLVESFFPTLPWKEDSEKHFFESVLQLSSGPLEVGGISWPCFGGLLATWIITFFCVFRGTQSTGFAAYITVPLPVILLIIFLIRGITLPGAWDGIKLYLAPDFSLLFHADIWLAAAGQIFFSLSAGSGIMTAFGSYTKKKQDIVVDNLIICFSVFLFSFMCGFVVFSILGYLAMHEGKTIHEVTRGGLGLGFITFPAAISLLPLPNLFAVFMFVSMFTLGIDSAFGMVEAVTSVLHDWYPQMALWKVALIVCGSGFAAGVPYSLRNGYYWMDIMDHYLSSYCLLITGIIECIAVGYFMEKKGLRQKLREASVAGMSSSRRYWTNVRVFAMYSVDNLRLLIKSNSKHLPVPSLWSICIKFVVPVALSVICIVEFVNEIFLFTGESGGYGGYPIGSVLIGAAMPILFVVTVVLFALIPSCLKKGNRSDNEEGMALEEALAELRAGEQGEGTTELRDLEMAKQELNNSADETKARQHQQVYLPEEHENHTDIEEHLEQIIRTPTSVATKSPMTTTPITTPHLVNELKFVRQTPDYNRFEDEDEDESEDVHIKF